MEKLEITPWSWKTIGWVVANCRACFFGIVRCLVVYVVSHLLFGFEYMLWRAILVARFFAIAYELINNNNFHYSHLSYQLHLLPVLFWFHVVLVAKLQMWLPTFQKEMWHFQYSWQRNYIFIVVLSSPFLSDHVFLFLVLIHMFISCLKLQVEVSCFRIED